MLAPATRGQVRRLNEEIARLRAGIGEEAERCERMANALDSGVGYGETRGARMAATARRLRALLDKVHAG